VLYAPGPGTNFFEALLFEVFNPMTYLGPSTTLLGKLYDPGPGFFLDALSVRSFLGPDPTPQAGEAL